MKKILFTASIIVLTVFAASAQSRISWGFTSSLDWNSFVFANADYLKGRSGFSVGPFMRSKISDRASLDVGLNYSQKSYDFKSGYYVAIRDSDPLAGVEAPTVTYKYVYLDIPVDFNYKLNKKESVDFYLSGGVVNSLLLDYKREISDTSSVTSDYSSRDKYLLSAKVGVGVLFKIKSIAIGIEPQVRYYVTNANIWIKKPIHIGLEISIIKL